MEILLSDEEEALDLLNELQNDPRMFYRVEISND